MCPIYPKNGVGNVRSTPRLNRFILGCRLAIPTIVVYFLNGWRLFSRALQIDPCKANDGDADSPVQVVRAHIPTSTALHGLFATDCRFVWRAVGCHVELPPWSSSGTAFTERCPCLGLCKLLQRAWAQLSRNCGGSRRCQHFGNHYTFYRTRGDCGQNK